MYVTVCKETIIAISLKIDRRRFSSGNEKCNIVVSGCFIRDTRQHCQSISSNMILCLEYHHSQRVGMVVVVVVVMVIVVVVVLLSTHIKKSTSRLLICTVSRYKLMQIIVGSSAIK